MPLSEICRASMVAWAPERRPSVSLRALSELMVR